jgi:FMN phosphatase YigB (HAD superfamily)
MPQLATKHDPGLGAPRVWEPTGGDPVVPNRVIQPERLAAVSGFEDITDVIVYSHEVGLAKPDPRFYSLTCERLAATPSDMVFLDDVPEAVETARRAGWQAVLFRDNAQAIAEVAACLAS